jgi:hypothetical protein
MGVGAIAAKIALGLGLLLLASGNLRAEVTGTCTGGCGEAASCCDCSKSLGGGPGCCLACGAPGSPTASTPKACCRVGGGAGCRLPDSCCSNADCTGGQICQVTDKPYATCSCPIGQTFCSGQCVDTGFNDLNCGVCGHKCPSDADTCSPGRAFPAPSVGYVSAAANRPVSAHPITRTAVPFWVEVFAPTSSAGGASAAIACIFAPMTRIAATGRA